MFEYISCLYSLSVTIEVKCQFLQDIIKVAEKQVKQELERRSTLENRNWSDRSSRSTTTTLLTTHYSFLACSSNHLVLVLAFPCSRYNIFLVAQRITNAGS